VSPTFPDDAEPVAPHSAPSPQSDCRSNSCLPVDYHGIWPKKILLKYLALKPIAINGFKFLLFLQWIVKLYFLIHYSRCAFKHTIRK